MNIFDYDSMLSQIIFKIADFFILNILVIICSIPIFTIGTALTAAHYVSIKKVRGSGESVTKLFFKSFKCNFKQSTLISIIAVLIVSIITVVYKILKHANGTAAFVGGAILLMQMIIVVMVIIWLFPVQARFINKVSDAIRFSWMLCFKNLGKTFLMILEIMIPICIPVISNKLSILIFLFGISVPIYLNALTYDKVFMEQENIIIQREKSIQEKKDKGSLN